MRGQAQEIGIIDAVESNALSLCVFSRETGLPLVALVALLF